MIHRRFCFGFILILFLLPLCFLCLSLESWGFVLSSYLQHNSKKLLFLKRGTWFVQKCVYIYVCVSVNVWYMCEIAYFKLWYYWVILKMKDLFLRDVTFLRSSHISNLKYVINFEFSFLRFCSYFTRVQHIDNISFEIIYKVQEICV